MARHLTLAAALFAAGLLVAQPASADIFTYEATLSGAAEEPPNFSPGIGTATVTIDDVAMTMQVEASFSGLLGMTTAAHIHCCTTLPGSGVIGVATTTPTFPFFPLGVSSGSYDFTFDLSEPGTFNGSFVTANGGTAESAAAALMGGLDAGRAYFNIHTSSFGGGEIRGFLTPMTAEVPEPSTAALLLLGIVGLAAGTRRRRLDRC